LKVVEIPAQIRPLEEHDHADVVSIYNYYVEHSHCTFDVLPFTLSARTPWFEQFSNPLHQCLVASRDDHVIGYACSMPFKSKPAYRTSVEVSIYLAQDVAAHGLGSQLYQALFDLLKDQPLHRAYAGIALPNLASMALHEKFGFTQTGIFEEVGYKFERYWDVVWLVKALQG
jgi:phosphinothricin acetyltransferase